jgi:hypothetical protein
MVFCALTLALGTVSVGSPAIADDSSIKIAVVTHGQSSDAYWGVVKKGVDDAAKLMGVDVSYQAPQTTDMVAMSRMIDAAVTQKVQGLVVSIPDARGCAICISKFPRLYRSRRKPQRLAIMNERRSYRLISRAYWTKWTGSNPKRDETNSKMCAAPQMGGALARQRVWNSLQR